MEVNPHDLLEIACQSDLISFSPQPDWVGLSLDRAPFVVVRRARSAEGLISVGVRGEKRNERFAAFLPSNRIVKRVTPEQLAFEKKWRERPESLFTYVEEVSYLMEKFSLNWGPTGSVGFELASDKETVTEASDVDVIIRADSRLTKELCQQLMVELRKVPVALDVQVEISEGAFSLSEYASTRDGKIILRTMDGPILKQIGE
ncbi:malonate decarboxylase holo-ACP synthase [Sporosarcina sp. GW1-11]|uniref:malonate decarboxylase holo-ACP synthase n=1 Tax=Sporosarcina sp. GW1-11 TaxID=2899126 RepID=UPI00294C520B|nr:malonate decarboxylase holo-ACP synthase [Sporosarcina sp. GW1-11]MDV6378576.1 malonate decarboxylase holo-ACP synthase [Sporosarcina sp. GW1-11]